MNCYRALASILVGALTALIWMQYKWFGLYEIIPGFIFASIAIVVVSLLTTVPSQIAVKRFIKAEAEYKASQ
ncbi:Sodium/proline symporter [Arsenophonus endosymbiont of Bemisia tabaci Q2]|nr:Sodium/proline symporter [Arsenophonus endosymbiont of Bemisia tabaci Q2]